MTGAVPEDIAAALVDEDALKAHLAHNLPGDGADFHVTRHQAGHSNETFFVTWGGAEYVLRRPPLGPLLPTAHDVLREHRVLSALQGTKARVPRAVLACSDEDVLGAPFYLCERVRGHVLRQHVPPALDAPGDRRRVGEELVDALAEVHAVDWEAAGLEGFGKPHGYLERQVRRWRGQLELTQPATEESRDVPQLREVSDWLRDHVPESPRHALVHGDYKLDNVVYAPRSPARVAAVLDWEMSTIGDPLADLGWMLSFWRDPGDPAGNLLSVTPRFMEGDGFLRRRDLIRRYEAATGVAVENLQFYVVLAVFKLATLLEGSYARHLMGMTDDPFFREMEWAVPALAARALDVARGEDAWAP